MNKPLIVLPPFFMFYGTPNNWMFQKPNNELDAGVAAAWTGGKVFNSDYRHNLPTLPQREWVMEQSQVFTRRIRNPMDPLYAETAGVILYTLNEMQGTELWIEMNHQTALAG